MNMAIDSILRQINMKNCQAIYSQLRCIVSPSSASRCGVQRNIGRRLGVRHSSTIKSTSTTPSKAPSSKPAPTKASAKSVSSKFHVAPKKPLKPVAVKPASKYTSAQSWKPTPQRGMSWYSIHIHKTQDALLSINSCTRTCPSVSCRNREDRLSWHVAYSHDIRMRRCIYNYSTSILCRWVSLVSRAAEYVLYLVKKIEWDICLMLIDSCHRWCASPYVRRIYHSPIREQYLLAPPNICTKIARGSPRICEELAFNSNIVDSNYEDHNNPTYDRGTCVWFSSG